MEKFGFVRGMVLAMLSGVIAVSAVTSVGAERPDNEPKAKSGDTEAAAMTPAEEPNLTGTRWRVTGLNGQAVGMAGDLHFDTNRVDGASACNFFGGTFAQKPGGGLTVSVDRMTRRGCSGEALKLESGYMDVLKSVKSFVFEGGEDAQLVFLDEHNRRVATLTRNVGFQLENTPLKIVSYLFEDGLHNVEPGTKPTLKFSNGRMEGDTGCTHFSGAYTLEDKSVNITFDMTVPKSATCPENERQQDSAILANLEKAARFDTGRNLIRLLHPEKEWAVLWLTLDHNPPGDTAANKDAD